MDLFHGGSSLFQEIEAGPEPDLIKSVLNLTRSGTEIPGPSRKRDFV
jgi:hypothetical protein